MSIKSYKQIYGKFAELFPEMNKAINTWKGVSFADRHIVLHMNDGRRIHFFYCNENFWFLRCTDEGYWLLRRTDEG